MKTTRPKIQWNTENPIRVKRVEQTVSWNDNVERTYKPRHATIVRDETIVAKEQERFSKSEEKYHVSIGEPIDPRRLMDKFNVGDLVGFTAAYEKRNYTKKTLGKKYQELVRDFPIRVYDLGGLTSWSAVTYNDDTLIKSGDFAIFLGTQKIAEASMTDGGNSHDRRSKLTVMHRERPVFLCRDFQFTVRNLSEMYIIR